MRKHVLTLSRLLAVFCLVPLFLQTGLAQAKTVKLAYIPIGDCLQLYVAEDKGFFAQEGLEVAPMAMKGGAVIAPAVEAGEAQIGWSNAVSIIIAHAKGFDFAFLTSGAISQEGGHRVHSLMIAADSPMTSVKDLAGKTVAINTLGNINELSLRALAEAEGLDVASVKLVEAPFPNMEAALKNGSVDAYIAVEPFVTVAKSHNTAKALVESAHKSFGERFMIGSWFAKKSWVKDNPDTAAAFARAIDKASVFIRDNPEAAREILSANTKLAPELAEKIALPAFDPKLDPADVQPLVDACAKYGLIPAVFPAADVIAAP